MTRKWLFAIALLLAVGLGLFRITRGTFRSR